MNMPLASLPSPLRRTNSRRILAATNHTSLIRNITWNFLGMGLPLTLGACIVPQLLRELGNERFGLLTLAWGLIGYFSLFDFGLGRALTQLVGEQLGAGDFASVPVCLRTGLTLMLALGLIGALVILCLSSHLASLVHASAAVRPELKPSLCLIACCIPLVTLTAGLKGFLEAHQCFAASNVLRLILGVLTFLGPIVALRFAGARLTLCIGALIAARVVTLFGHVVATHAAIPDAFRASSFSSEFTGRMLRFGGWMTVSNIISPLMALMDRFMIAGMLSASVVAYYSIPGEIVTKLLIIPSALTGVLFPAFTIHLAAGTDHAPRLFRKGVAGIFVLMYPLTLVVLAFGHRCLGVWLNAEYAQHSTIPLQLLAIGVLVNGFACVPFAFLQSARRPDLTAMLHMAELPLYIMLAYLLIRSYGITGAAVAWLIRVAADALLLFLVADRWTVAPLPRPGVAALFALPIALAYVLGHSNNLLGVRLVCVLAPTVFIALSLRRALLLGEKEVDTEISSWFSKRRSELI